MSVSTARPGTMAGAAARSGCLILSIVLLIRQRGGPCNHTWLHGVTGMITGDRIDPNVPFAEASV